MPILETVINGTLDCTTIGSELYSTSTCALDGDGNITPEGTTTLTCMTSTILGNAEISTRIIKIHNSIAYVESMSDEELAMLDKNLSEKGLELEKIAESVERTEAPKVYKK